MLNRCLNKEGALVGAFTAHCETSRRFVDSSNSHLHSAQGHWVERRPARFMSYITVFIQFIVHIQFY